MKYNRRQFTRVIIQRDVILDFGKNKYEYSVSNFSLSGMYVQGCFKQQVGDICTMKLIAADIDPNVKIGAICSVVRIDSKGVALKFTSMEPDSFLFLQGTLLYEPNAHWCRLPNGLGDLGAPLFNWKML
jgi:hypothetical protein